MNAKFTIVTHFSQKYSKMPVLPEDCAENVGFAFDFMQVYLKINIFEKTISCTFIKKVQMMIPSTPVCVNKDYIWKLCTSFKVQLLCL